MARKKFIFTIILFLHSIIAVWAIPARPGGMLKTQPDGSIITLYLHGDEYLHYHTTEDGYSVVKDRNGYYVYAQSSQGCLIPTGRIAHSPLSRSTEERIWLQGIEKHQRPVLKDEKLLEREAEMSRRAHARRAAIKGAPLYDYSNFKSLVILVQFNDRKFSMPNSKQLFSDIFSKENYKGFDDTPLGQYTGSVRDYFFDNSNGRFLPQFDIVGPITIDFSQYDANGSENARILTKAAIEAADSQVDFSLYDGDEDGVVDMVYFVFAGLTSSESDDERLIWPHAGTIWDNGYVTLDGIQLGQYACSSEFLGSDSEYFGDVLHISGIGTICHEISHVLGLPDLYDTDGETNGLCDHPNEWSIMSEGGYQNHGLTPTGYTLYERYALGFATPELIDEPGNYTLPPIGESNKGYRLNTPVENEFFLLENRQTKSKWDQYLPGHGMLVFRVDSTYAPLWSYNKVNCFSKRKCFELIRAASNDDYGASSSDPFPGSKDVHSLTNTSKPGNLLTWSSQPNAFCLDNIDEDSDGIVSFSVVKVQKANFVPGDDNDDGTVNFADVEEVKNYIFGRASTSFNGDAADMNGDGIINAADIVLIINAMNNVQNHKDTNLNIR